MEINDILLFNTLKNMFKNSEKVVWSSLNYDENRYFVHFFFANIKIRVLGETNFFRRIDYLKQNSE